MHFWIRNRLPKQPAAIGINILSFFLPLFFLVCFCRQIIFYVFISPVVVKIDCMLHKNPTEHLHFFKPPKTAHQRF